MKTGMIQGMSSFRTQLKLLGALLVVAFIAGGIAIQTGNGPFHSVEVRFTESSPKGEEGGVVVPASCPSYAHVSGECNPPSFSCSPATVQVGGTTTCTWTCAPGSTSSAGGNFSTGGGTSGSQVVTVNATTNYSVQCAPVGNQTNFSVTGLSPTLTLSATPARVRSGSTASLSWSATSVNSCVLKKSTTTVASCASGAACASTQTTSTGALTTQSVFILTCQTDVGVKTATATVFITPRVCEVGTADCPN